MSFNLRTGARNRKLKTFLILVANVTIVVAGPVKVYADEVFSVLIETSERRTRKFARVI